MKASRITFFVILYFVVGFLGGCAVAESDDKNTEGKKETEENSEMLACKNLAKLAKAEGNELDTDKCLTGLQTLLSQCTNPKQVLSCTTKASSNDGLIKCKYEVCKTKANPKADGEFYCKCIKEFDPKVYPQSICQETADKYANDPANKKIFAETIKSCK